MLTFIVWLLIVLAVSFLTFLAVTLGLGEDADPMLGTTRRGKVVWWARVLLVLCAPALLVICAVTWHEEDSKWIVRAVLRGIVYGKVPA